MAHSVSCIGGLLVFSSLFSVPVIISQSLLLRNKKECRAAEETVAVALAASAAAAVAGNFLLLFFLQAIALDVRACFLFFLGLKFRINSLDRFSRVGSIIFILVLIYQAFFACKFDFF